MTQRNGRRDEELDLDLMYINKSSLAKKAEIRQYPSGRQDENRRRNPYLVDYTTISKGRPASSNSRNRDIDKVDLIWGETVIPPIPREQKESGKRPEHQEPDMERGGSGKRGGQPARRPVLNKQVHTVGMARSAVGSDTERRRIAQIRRRKKIMRRRIALGTELAVVLLLTVLVFKFLQKPATVSNDNPVEQENQGNQNQLSGLMVQGIPAEIYAKHPQWKEDFLTVNDNSRPGDPIGEVKSIFVHYTANPGTSAAQNRSYFEQLKDNKERSASAHFIIGYEGEIIQCVPLDEIAYAVIGRNEDSLSIECCYLAEDGSFTQETYDSLVRLLSWLTTAYNLDDEDILRHYDSGGKRCPIYYVEKEEAWEELKANVKADTL